MQTNKENSEYELSPASAMVVPVVFVAGLFVLVALLSQIT